MTAPGLEEVFAMLAEATYFFRREVAPTRVATREQFYRAVFEARLAKNGFLRRYRTLAGASLFTVHGRVRRARLRGRGRR